MMIIGLCDEDFVKIDLILVKLIWTNLMMIIVEYRKIMMDDCLYGFAEKRLLVLMFLHCS